MVRGRALWRGRRALLRGKTKVKYALTFVLLACVSTANAVPISYRITFEVEEVAPWQGSHGVVPSPGDIYSGFFALDSAGLQADGTNRGIPLISFAATIADASWCFNVACGDNQFFLFRGPTAPFFGSPSPGFDVLNGDVVNLRGGVAAVGDSPFVDFSYNYSAGAPSSDPTCVGPGYCGNQPNHFWANLGGSDTLHGSMHVTRVPEPSTLLLLAGALVALARKRRSSPPANACRPFAGA